MCGKEEKTLEEQEMELRDDALRITEAFNRGWKAREICSTREREIIESVIGLGMSFEETAENYGINLKTVYFHWGNALTKIRGLV